MCDVVQKLSASLLSLLLMPLLVQAQDKTPSSFTTQKTTATGEIVGDLAGTWWVWAGIIGILCMLGLLFFLRKRTAD
jgi:LPXTG-motif cell wall-anchored protein